MREIFLNTIQKTSPDYRRYSVFVDDEDFNKVAQYNWWVYKQSNTCYAIGKINGKHIRMHNFITGFKRVDHKDHNGLNNQRTNLREATQQQNCMNRKINHNNYSSRYKGVSFKKTKHGGKIYSYWIAQIQVGHKKVHIGNFKSEVNAGQAYNFMAEKLFGEFANYNKA